MDKFLTGDSKMVFNPKPTVTVGGKKLNIYKCPHCDKTSYSVPGLKCHVTKMHHEIAKDNGKTNQNESTNEHEQLITNGANKVIRHLIKDILNLNEDVIDNTEIEEVTLDESVDIEEKLVEKKYTHKCETCEYEAKANKKYLAFQLIRSHKVSCNGNRNKKVKKPVKCDQCDLVINERLNMKRHVSDEHEAKCESSSPPTKKKKTSIDEFNERIEMMEMESDNIGDLSFKLEDMEIDVPEEEVVKERSNKMDEKIQEKEKKESEKELSRKTKQEEKEKKKQKVAELKAVKTKELKLKQKQKQKDQKKKERKKGKAKVKVSIDGETFNVPNIRNIPENCKHLVQKGDILYVVPGDGCCGPNCAAAFLFQDEIFGPKLRIRMNLFFAKHWDSRYQYISQCSPGHPFKRKIKGHEIEFTDPQNLIKFLENSSDAAYMWSDSEDLAILADMFQIRIKIITTKGSTDENPTTNWIYPDPKLKPFAELNNVDINDMVLLHDNDSHFNLIISSDSDLAKFGSLSNRFNVGPFEEEVNKDAKSSEKIDVKQDELEDADQKTENEVLTLKKELKQCKESKEIILKEYLNCEKELRIKTEEAEKQKVEIKDLRKIVKLRSQLKDKETGDSPMDVDEDDSVENAEVLLKMKNKGFKRKDPQTESTPNVRNIKKTVKEYICQDCDFKGSTELNLKNHTIFMHTSTVKDGEGEFNCQHCDFQGSQEIQLRKHIQVKHTRRDTDHQGSIKCRICGEGFQKKEI